MTERLRSAPAPGEEQARRRAWELAQAALADRPPVRVRRRIARALVPAAAAILAVAMLSPPGGAVGDWVRARARAVVGTAKVEVARPVATVPGGRLLALTPDGPTVFGLGRPRRLLGPVGDATPSPHGLYVAAALGRRLTAVDMGGRRHWTVTSPHAVAAPRWSPSGYRVAYLSGTGPARWLRVVAGDGTGDHVLARAGSAPPAWRPGPGHVLAYADRAGRVVLRDADSGAVLWRTRPHVPPRRLAWAADARRLLVLARGRTYVVDGRSGALVRHGRGSAVEAAYRPRSADLALVRRDPRTDESRVILVRGGRERFLFGAPGTVRGLAWSPDGRWLAVGVARAHAVVLLRPGRDGLAGARSLDAAGGRLAGWR